MADDASLHDVAFVDDQHGWAVGAHGVVWATSNAGADWRRQPTPADCPLRGVSFVSPRRGWAVGGRSVPYAERTEGVVLATDDGGETWRRVSRDTLPRLRAVKFFDARRGLAVGAGGPVYPSGALRTEDGGQSWTSLSAEQTCDWRALDALSPEAALVAGPRGLTGRGAGGGLAVQHDPGESRGARALRITGPATAWAVGDGALVRTTRDAGRNWRSPASDPPAELARWFDWRALDAVGERLWAAGSPGSVVLHSPDGGRSWRLLPTGVSTPINAITFVDDQRGWAVGELGVILATRDGGQTWVVQRGAGRRAAIGVVAPSAAGLPVELIAANAAAEGYRTTVASPFAPAAPLAHGDTASRLDEAAARCAAAGASTGWRLPLEPTELVLPAEELLARLDRATDGKSREMLIEPLVAWIRAWRPEAVLIPEIGPEASSHSSGAVDLLVEAVQEAAAAAADPTQRRELAALGLPPWRVRSVLRIGPAEADASTRLGTGDFHAALGSSPALWARPAVGIIRPDYRGAQTQFGWTLVAGQPPHAARRGDVLAGAAVSPGGDARRPLATPADGQLDRLRRVAQKRRHLEGLLQRSQADPAWAGQVMALTGGLDAEGGAELLYQLADGYRQRGSHDLAADTFYLLARRYGDSPLTESALVWLVSYYSSAEFTHLQSLTMAQQQGDTRGPRETLANRGADAARLEAVDESPTDAADGRLGRAAALADYLARARPAVHAAPRLRFAVAAAQRSRGFGGEAERAMLLMSKQAVAEDWRRAADAERWLAEPKEIPPAKPTAQCRSTAKRPLLDGVLDEACWAAAETIALGDPQDAATGRLRVARDNDFLYFAIECPRLPGRQAPAAAGAPRARDEFLDNDDRVTLRLDTDRDYTTAFELTVDERGRTHDAVWGSPHWDPQWYVAAGGDDTSWRVEAATPIGELTGEEELLRAAWAVSAERHAPGHAPRAWTGAAAESRSPDAYGLLLFD
ncbi:YCF48-related protein [Pseudobythopirellula maris]|uniref:YCF48-related protein n=1 Tax=Pseudobythopirellula maris TaxID=2527991 RepID=UPI0018D2E434|nr:YCF48-related protein [Pseudobythopirellula maris]